MDSQIIINIPTRLKKAAAQKAKAQGLALSTVFNLAAQAYVDDTLRIGAFEHDLAVGLREAKEGKARKAEAVFKSLGL